MRLQQLHVKFQRSDARSNTVLLGWSTSPNFPGARAQDQINRGWGVIDEENSGVRMIFIPGGVSTFISSSNTLYPSSVTTGEFRRLPAHIQCEEGAVFLVREGGVEPPHPFEYTDLNRARLPIPPLALFSFAEASQGYRLRSLEVHGSLSDYLRARQVCQHWH